MLTTHRPRPYLSAVPSEGSAIDGLVAEVSGDWDALDTREAGYARHVLRDTDHPLEPEREVRIYAVARETMLAPDATTEPLILSYIDVVAQGYLQVFGEAGLKHFFETTDGWGIPIRNDRSDPVYSRAQKLTEREIALTDAALSAVGARVL